MAIYSSGSLRFNGLGSDTNFDEMIEKLYAIESRQATQLLKWKQDWETRLDAFKQLRSELVSLQLKLSSLNTMDKFAAKATTSSDEKVATGVAGADCLDSAYNVEVNQLATAYTWSQNTGLFNKSDVITDGTAGVFEYTYKGKTRQITVPAGTTAEGLVKLINNDSKNPGARAQLIQGADGITFQMYGKETGKANVLEITDTTGLKIGTSGGTASNWTRSGSNSMSINTGRADTDDIHTSGSNKSFVYYVDNKAYTVNIPSGTKWNELAGLINTQHGSSIATWSSGVLTLTEPDTTYTINLDPDGTTDVAGEIFGPGLGKTGQNTIVNDTGSDLVYKIEVVNDKTGETETITFAIEPDMTWLDIKNSLEPILGKYMDIGWSGSYDHLTFTPKVEQHHVSVGAGSLDELAYTVSKPDQWQVIEGQNAKLKVNGWPGDRDTGLVDPITNEPIFEAVWFESATNNLKAGDIVDGLAINLKGTGKTTITVATDKEKIKENVYEFVDAVNTFRFMFNSLTEVNSEKQTYDPDYADSQFDMQKGAVLTGNYGVQMIGSRLKQSIAATALGFLPVSYASDGTYLGGDIFNSLSQIGVKTNAEQGNSMYGMLEIETVSGKFGSKTLDEALDEDPLAVARLFAANMEGVTDSTDFGFNSLLPAQTKAGSYEVHYEVDSSGNIDPLTCTINGQAASYDSTTQQITSTAGDSMGLVIDVYSSSLSSAGTVTGTVNVRQGKANELLAMMDGSEGMLGTSGTLKNLEKNYQTIIDNIETKIKREDERLAKWERTMINKFARLDAVLAKYNAMNEGLQSQIASLSGSSS